jgi:hypothetical protein
MGRRGVGSVKVGRLLRYPVDRPSTEEELAPSYVGLARDEVIVWCAWRSWGVRYLIEPVVEPIHNKFN